MELLYFGRVRARIGVHRETIAPPAEVADVDSLIEWLRDRGAPYDSALKDRRAIRVAVNQELCGFDAPVASGDEVALFPPMTGG